jgi:hypothetical protein
LFLPAAKVNEPRRCPAGAVSKLAGINDELIGVSLAQMVVAIRTGD